MALDINAAGQAVGAILLAAGGWIAGHLTKKGKAADGAEVAQANASAAVSDAEGTLYNRLREEIDALRNDVSRLRADLDQERRHSRALELHVWKLERLMREANLTPPPFVEANSAEATDQASH